MDNQRYKPDNAGKYMFAGAVLALLTITMLLLWQIGVYLSMPWVYVSTKTGECVHVQRSGVTYSCNRIPPKHHIVYVE